jgi:hypothetical protein
MRRDIITPKLGLLASSCLLAACTGATIAGGNGLLRCEIGVSDSVIYLRGDTLVALDEPGTQLVRDHRGFIYGGSYQGARLLKWDPLGRLVASVGGPGDGPGELGMGGISTFVVGDSIYVRDSHRHWVVYDSSLNVVRYSDTGPISAYGRYDTHFLPNDRLMSSFQRAELADHGIVILSRTGEVLKTIAPMPQTGASFQPRARPSVYSDDGRIWIGPVAGPRDGYRIEIWDTAGVLVDSIVRDVSWLRPVPDYEANYYENPEGRPFPYPKISLIFADSAGMVWVVSTLPLGPGSERAVRGAAMSEYREVFGRVMEFHFDVYDRDTKELVASRRFPATTAFMSDPLYDGRWLHRVTEDSLGFRNVSIVELTLEGRDGEECARLM